MKRTPMNNGTRETVPLVSSIIPANTLPALAQKDDLVRLKRELLQAEMRLAKARAAATSAEVDIKVLNTRLRAYK